MFPFDIDDNEIEIDVPETVAPSDYEIDFNTGKLTGRIVTGVDAVKQWVRLALGIERYYFTQYSWNYGSELQSLIGKSGSRDVLKSEAKRIIEDALLINDFIESVNDFDISIIDDRIDAKFTIITTFGDSEVEVNV